MASESVIEVNESESTESWCLNESIEGVKNELKFRNETLDEAIKKGQKLEDFRKMIEAVGGAEFVDPRLDAETEMQLQRIAEMTAQRDRLQFSLARLVHMQAKALTNEAKKALQLKEREIQELKADFDRRKGDHTLVLNERTQLRSTLFKVVEERDALLAQNSNLISQEVQLQAAKRNLEYDKDVLLADIAHRDKELFAAEVLGTCHERMFDFIHYGLVRFTALAPPVFKRRNYFDITSAFDLPYYVDTNNTNNPGNDPRAQPNELQEARNRLAVLQGEVLFALLHFISMLLLVVGNDLEFACVLVCSSPEDGPPRAELPEEQGRLEAFARGINTT